MFKGIGVPPRWRLATIGVQLGAVAACAWLGWGLLHPASSGAALTVQGQGTAPAQPAVPAVAAAPSVKAATPGVAAAGPALGDLVTRVNRDDLRLYRGQWATVGLIASATRDYLLRHVLPLLLAAAHGGPR